MYIGDNMDYPDFILDPLSNPFKMFALMGVLFFLFSYFKFKDFALIEEKDRLDLRKYGVISFFAGLTGSFLASIYPKIMDNQKDALSYVLIIIGFVLILLSFYIINNLKITKWGKNAVRLLGAICILSGCIIFFYSTNATIQGKIIDIDGNPMAQVKVQIDNLTGFSNIYGEYEIDNVPRESRFIKFTFPGYEKIQKINISKYSFGSKTEDISFKENEIKITIKGKIQDANGNKKHYYVTTINPDYFDHPGKNTSLDGDYDLSSTILSINHPITILIKELKSSQKILYQRDLAVSNEDITSGVKSVNIMLNQTIQVSGRVMEYCDQRSSPPIPARGATVQIGERINITDEEGNYLITHVPRQISTYKVKLVSGYEIKGNITPPLGDDIESTKMRNIWLCRNDTNNRSKI